MSVELWTPPTAVTVARHAFRTETLTLEVPHGATIDEMIVAAGLPGWATVRVWIGEWEVAPQYWGTTRPRPGRKVLIRAVPRGGGGDSNKTLRLVLMIVVVVAALALTIVTAGMGAPVLGGALLGLTGAQLGMIGAAAISIGGMYAVNALLPPPKPKLRDQTAIATSPTYALTGTQNQLAPYQAVPRVYGRHRLYPPLAAYPVTAGQGTTQTLSQLFTLGYGPLQIEDIRIGDTPIGLYEGVTLDVRHGWPPGVQPPLTTFPYDTFEEPLAIDLTPPEGSTSKTASRATTPADVIGIEVLFPRGLFRVEADNTTQGFSGVLTVVGVPASNGVAVRLLEQTITEQRVESLRFSYAFDVQAYGETPWTLHVTWTIPPGWEGPERPNPVVIFDLVWSALRLTRYVDPIPLPGMAKIGLTLLASGQLTGIVNQLNCIATSILPIWDVVEARWRQAETRNPAWIYRDILLGPATARPVALNQIDDPALLAWGADCDAKGYTFDAVFDTQTTVFEALSLVAAAGRASFSMRDGTYSVVRDVPQTVPVQQFTPRNSTGFAATKIFTDLPHALKVRFINPAANWQQDEVVVCDDGYTATPVGDGVERVVNGQFTTDLSGWTVTTTGVGWAMQAAGEARLTGAGPGQAFLSQAVPIAHGLQYRVSFTVTLSAVAFRAGSSEGAEDLVADQVLFPGAFTATFYTPASAPGSPACWLRFFKGDYETTGIDNVSVWVIAVDGADPGEELVVNGEFTTDLSGWTATLTGTGQAIQAAGEARLTGAAPGQAFVSQAVPTVVGSRYVVAFTVAHAPVTFRAGSSEGAQDLVLDRVVYPGPGSFQASFQAPSSACWLRFVKSEAEVTGIDNVSVQAFGVAMPTKFEGLEVFGVTDAALAWRHGRYWLAAARLRPETYTLGVDIEHLIAQRGDLVHVQHDVPLWGYGSGRIVRTIGPIGGVTAFVLDELFDTLEVGTVVAVRVRLQDGTSVLRGAGVTPDPATRSTLFGLDSPAANISVGDLVSVGEMGSETVPCLISRIEAGPDLSARLTLVDLAPGIHGADTGLIPPFESFVSRVPIRNRLPPPPPLYVAIGSDELAMLETAPGNWMISIRVTAYAVVDPTRLVPTLLELQFRPAGSAAQWQQAPPQTVTAGGVASFHAHPVQEGLTYDLRLRAIAMPESVASTWALAQHTVTGEITPPPPPINLSLDLDQTHLRWQYPTPPRDFPGGFSVRYAYGVTDRWEDAWPLHDGLVSDTRFALPPLGAGTYTFLVKAVDRAGHLSRDPAVLVSDYGGYAPTNILQIIDLDAAGFPGDQDSLVYEATPPPPRLCNALLADGPFWTLDSARVWSADPALFWGDVYAAGYYQIAIDVPVEDAGTTLTLAWAGTGPWVVEYCTTGDSAFWARHTPYFWETADTVFWSEGVSAWRPWPGALVVQAQRYYIRWSTPGPQEACLTQVHLVYDVADLITWVDDWGLPAAPSRLPLTQEYREILNVQITVVQSAGQPVRVVDVLDKSITGPLVQARLVDGTLSTAQIDAVIKGY